ncbi:hypothetical protein SAY86_012723 [Trapa natans]|uniref:Homeobox domain-containing protein n=1 Tax=Trapa natans TaxID=22666 RepID=A0AAN7M083_TRANT|nr:hypothetical protein SAY86_012723 [Trapa natans]
MASSTAAESASSNFCYPVHQLGAAHLMGQIPGGPDPSSFSNIVAVYNDPVNWQQESKLYVDDSSLRCVFPCKGNERPSQGLSLSLSSADPSSIGLQPFELRPMSNQPHGSVFGKSPVEMNMIQAAQIGKIQLRSSKYLGPVQELVNEFCSLGSDSAANNTQQQSHTDDQTRQKTQKPNKQWDEDANGNNASSSSNGRTHHPLSSLEFVELQKRKTKLLLLLEEVDRRYRHYNDRLKAVVSSYEAVAGQGSAKVYSALAWKAMSRHFRCLRDGIVSQIRETKKAMGEKDPPGTSRGEIPRLKIIDQALRQQRAFQQMSMMESHPWRPQRGLPEKSVSILRAWLLEHFLHPYPSDVDKHILARQTGLSRSQVSNWFINARVRLWKPMVEEMYLEETKEQTDNMKSSDGPITDQEYGIDRETSNHHNPHALHQRPGEQKPAISQLIRIGSECRLSSIITSPDKSDHNLPFRSAHQVRNPHSQQDQSILYQGFGQVGHSFGAMELDFASYNHHLAGGGQVAYDDHSTSHFSRGGVSLTLGLQQHGGSGAGISLAFTAASQGSMFYPSDHHIEECQPVAQHSLLDGEGQNLPYRNLMGAQLLHDLAG